MLRIESANCQKKYLSGLCHCEMPAATATLSWRWQFVWTFDKNLDFDGDKTLRRLMIEPSQLYYARKGREVLVHEAV